MTLTPAGFILAHDDHGLGVEHLSAVDDALKGWDGSLVKLVVPLPIGCPDLMSDLHGPAAGDEPVTEEEVTYERRGNRPGPSRRVDRPPRPCRSMVIIAGPGRDEPIIYTVYGGPAVSPREWWDSSMLPLETIEAATFWSEHALSLNNGGEE